jgi:hypothetical protein
MSKYKRTLRAFAVLLILIGVAQLFVTRVYYRHVYAVETHNFGDFWYPMNDGVRYDGLFDQALVLQQQVQGLVIAFHTMTGATALVVGFLLLAFACDRYIDLFGKCKSLPVE